MRGWVYIITTKAMPELLKVGFTLKDPELRARELGRTGLPHPYIVEYEVLVIHPKVIEKRVHASLSSKREAKEWFRCSVSHAVSVIREAVGSDVIFEKIRGSVEPEDPPEAPSETETSGPNKKPEQARKMRFQRTTTFSGPCINCGNRFTVTLTRYDSGARCPNCFRMNDTSAFVR